MYQASTTSSIQVHHACHRTIIPAGDQSQVVYFLTEILPEPALESLPLNIVFVMDRNGPILKECLPGIKQALRDLVEQLSPRDRFSLVSIGGQVVIPSQPVDDARAIARLIDHFTIGEEARSSAGLAEGLCQAISGQASGVVSRLVLVLSGEATGPAQDFLALADKANQHGIPILAVGVGSTWAESFLFDLTGRSAGIPPGCMNGQVYYIPTPDDISTTARELFAALALVARQVQVRFLVARSLHVAHIWQVKPVITNLDWHSSGHSPLTIPAGELEKVGQAYLVEVQFPPRAPGPTRIAQIEVSYQLPGIKTHRQVSDLVINFVADSGGTNPLDAHVMDMVEAAQAHELCQSAIQDLDSAKRQEAAKKLRQAAAILTSQGHILLGDRIRGEADYNIHRYGQVSHEGRKLILLASQRGPSG